MNIQKKLLLIVFPFLFHIVGYGQNAFLEGYYDQTGMAIGVKATSFGPGVEVNASLNKSFSLRAGAAFYTYRYSEDINTGDAIARNARVYLGNISLGLDWQFISFFHMSGGVLYNFSHINFDVVPSVPTAQNNGTVSYELRPHKYCPYFTLGFGRSVSKKRILSVGFDVGFTYQGETIVTYDVQGTIDPRKLSKWTYNVTSNSKFYKVYPIISLLFAFRIF